MESSGVIERGNTALYILHVLGFDVLSRRIGAVALLAGLTAAAVYGQAGLTLAHYDARAHLVVARRVLDSITPGWQQIGAVWLPVPHVLNMLPVQIDLFYRTGASAIAFSVLAINLVGDGLRDAFDPRLRRR